jgi:hypothetical protein
MTLRLRDSFRLPSSKPEIIRLIGEDSWRNGTGKLSEPG